MHLCQLDLFYNGHLTALQATGLSVTVLPYLDPLSHPYLQRLAQLMALAMEQRHLTCQIYVVELVWVETQRKLNLMYLVKQVEQKLTHLQQRKCLRTPTLVALTPLETTAT
jgi:hypothetical protein